MVLPKSPVLAQGQPDICGTAVQMGGIGSVTYHYANNLDFRIIALVFGSLPSQHLMFVRRQHFE
jgi:hypothetical protein